jgi:hypothetical protein
MSKTQSWMMMGLSSVVLVIGALLATGALTSAQTNAPSTTPSATTAPSGTFQSNEDPTHEIGESAAHEANENSGNFHPGSGHGSNEDPTHEGMESAQREAQEGTGQAPSASPAPTSSTPGA